MADDCGICLALPEKFGCGWCQGSDRCEVQEQCGAPSVWSNRIQSCPNPEIHSFRPQLGPWDGRTNITLGRNISDIYNYTTPRTDTLSSIPDGQYNFTAELPVRTTQVTDFVTKNFTSFDCNTYSSCTQCVSSFFPCDWCIDGNRCTHDTAENCRNDILVTGVSRMGPSYRSGPGFCPTINSTSDGTNEILVPSGVKKAIKVKVHIIGQFIVQTRFVCQFNIEGRVTHVNAQLLADTIYCEPVEFTYTSHAPNITASFAVIWGGSKPLDNPNNTHILIYRCSDMADDCGICLALPEKFGCGWCQGSDRCEVQEQCGAPSVWSNRIQSCPNPEIHSFRPQLGPWDGRTNITLGRNISDIYNYTTPRTDTLSSIPDGQYNFTAKLPVRTTQVTDFITKNFTSFDCNTYSSCTQCVSSFFPCDWCIDGNRCTHDTAENCRNDILVTGVSRMGPSYRSGPGFCPTINSTSDGTNEILVPSGVKKAIKVKVHIIGQFIVQTRFVCQFNIEGCVTHVNAQLLADTIYCEPVEFTYTSHAPNITASFAVIWGGSKPLDNPNNTHILIYRCSDMADDCGICLALPEKFGCGWCQGSDRCEVQEQCGAPSVWSNRIQSCPNPEIHSFRPQLGPWDGRTNITLGRNMSDIYNYTTTRTDTLSSIPDGQYNFTAKLPVRTTQVTDFVTKNFTSFDCNTYSSCTQCVSSFFPCDWCIDGNRCTHDTAENCRNDILVTGVSRMVPSYRSGPGFCPTINSTSDGTNEILVPFGVKKAIKVKVHIIGQFIVQTRFVCQFNIEGRVIHVNAQLLADTIYCEPVEFTYTSRAPNITASFDVIWGGSKPLDNPNNTHILIYRCSDMADDSGTCLALPEKFGCGWCQGTDLCEVQEQCGAPSVWIFHLKRVTLS
ncbi:unnamed protein product [Parnassius apollo]|uniref:(apollo) hypothetical protein n=1 Tax=Parnassius apollo TaxID=110799 RepID=A0A8S3XJC8_PARAO|nr:unnamed protein product [Parnassius apollo]